MPLKNRKDIIASLKRLELHLSAIDNPHDKGAALKEMGLLLDTFDREKKRPKGGKKGC